MTWCYFNEQEKEKSQGVAGRAGDTRGLLGAH